MRPVVVGVDGSAHSATALKAAVVEAARRDAPLHVLYVSDVTPAILHLPGEVSVNTTDLAALKQQQVWDEVETELAGSGDVSRVDLEGYPADAIVDYCEREDAQLVVVGTRGRGKLASTLLGSTSKGVVERAGCDVLVAKNSR